MLQKYLHHVANVLSLYQQGEKGRAFEAYEALGELVYRHKRDLSNDALGLYAELGACLLEHGTSLEEVQNGYNRLIYESKKSKTA